MEKLEFVCNVLDPDIWLAQQLEEYRRNYEAGHQQSRDLAFSLCTSNRHALPDWLTTAMIVHRSSGRRGRAHSPEWRVRMAKFHAIRWNFASHCIKRMRSSIAAWQALSAEEQDAVRRRSDGGYYRAKELESEDNPSGLFECSEAGAFEMAHAMMCVAGSSALASAAAIAESYAKVQKAIASGDARLYMAALREF